MNSMMRSEREFEPLREAAMPLAFLRLGFFIGFAPGPRNPISFGSRNAQNRAAGQ
jgi:hypothetical protein